MPTYDYRCRSCQGHFSKTETIAQHSSGSQVTCPTCRSTDVERILSPSYPRTPRKS